MKKAYTRLIKTLEELVFFVSELITEVCQQVRGTTNGGNTVVSMFSHFLPGAGHNEGGQG